MAAAPVEPSLIFTLAATNSYSILYSAELATKEVATLQRQLYNITQERSIILQIHELIRPKNITKD